MPTVIREQGGIYGATHSDICLAPNISDYMRHREPQLEMVWPLLHYSRVPGGEAVIARADDEGVLAVAANAKAKDRRRVVMFCACEEPILKCDDGLPNCHRVEVASLLLKAAKKRGLMLQMSEWPGESPVSLRVKANDSQTRAFATGAHYIPIGSVDARLPAMVTLGWGSNVRFVSPDKTWTVVTGPASVARNKWRLKVFDEADFTEGMSARERGDALLRAGYGPRSTGLRTR